jgi:hypothetical protein
MRSVAMAFGAAAAAAVPGEAQGKEVRRNDLKALWL